MLTYSNRVKQRKRDPLYESVRSFSISGVWWADSSFPSFATFILNWRLAIGFDWLRSVNIHVDLFTLLLTSGDLRKLLPSNQFGHFSLGTSFVIRMVWIYHAAYLQSHYRSFLLSPLTTINWLSIYDWRMERACSFRCMQNGCDTNHHQPPPSPLNERPLWAEMFTQIFDCLDR